MLNRIIHKAGITGKDVIIDTSLNWLWGCCSQWMTI